MVEQGKSVEGETKWKSSVFVWVSGVFLTDNAIFVAFVSRLELFNQREDGGG